MKHSLSVIVLVLLAAGTVLSQKARLEVSKLVNISFFTLRVSFRPVVDDV